MDVYTRHARPNLKEVYRFFMTQTQHLLSNEAIIRAGHARDTRRMWERIGACTRALYGPKVRQVTIARKHFPIGDHHIWLPQMLAFDDTGKWLQYAYDFTTPWWREHGADDTFAVRYSAIRSIEETQGLGAAFPDEIRSAIRTYVEQATQVEILHQWGVAGETSQLVWMFDLAAPPSLVYDPIEADGKQLDEDAVSALGMALRVIQRWEGVREFVHTLYGPQAVSATLTNFSEYNDSTYDSCLPVDVYDATGNALIYDFHQPWWQPYAVTEAQSMAYAATIAHERNPYPDEPFMRVSFQRWYPPAESQHRIHRMEISLLEMDSIATTTEWDPVEETFDLRQPPSRPYGEVRGTPTE